LNQPAFHDRYEINETVRHHQIVGRFRRGARAIPEAVGNEPGDDRGLVRACCPTGRNDAVRFFTSATIRPPAKAGMIDARYVTY